MEIETLKSQFKGEADTVSSSEVDHCSPNTSKEKLVKSLQKELKDVKRQLETKDNELAEAQEEMSTLKEDSKEREKSLRAKLKDAVAENDRLSGVEVSDEMASRETNLTAVPGGFEHAAEHRAIIQDGGVLSQEIKASTHRV